MEISAEPLFEAVELMYIMFSTPLIWSSKGAITLFNTVCALAPVYVALTDTVGGAISGYWVTGKEIKPRKPKMTIKMEITVESTGRFINLSNFMFFVFTRQKRIFVLFYDYILIKSGLQITVMLVFQGLIVLCFLLLTSNRLDLLTVFQDLYAFHDNLIARLQAICY